MNYKNIHNNMQIPEEQEMYLIQLFDYNCPSGMNGVTKIFVENIDQFAGVYQKLEKEQERIKRLFQSKEGQIVTDYYCDDPSLNIVQRINVEHCGDMVMVRNNETIIVVNGWGWESEYFFEYLEIEVKLIAYQGKHYKLVKPSGRNCCLKNVFNVENPWRKISIYGNPFWIYRETTEIPCSASSVEKFKGNSIESYVWQVADEFNDGEEMRNDIERTWLTEMQVSRAFADLPGEAG